MMSYWHRVLKSVQSAIYSFCTLTTSPQKPKSKDASK